LEWKSFPDPERSGKIETESGTGVSTKNPPLQEKLNSIATFWVWINYRECLMYTNKKKSRIKRDFKIYIKK